MKNIQINTDRIKSELERQASSRLEIGKIAYSFAREATVNKRKATKLLNEALNGQVNDPHIRECLQIFEVYKEIVDTGRSIDLSPEHFAAVHSARLNKQDRVEILSQAADYDLSVAETKLLVAKTLQEKKPKTVTETKLQDTLVKAVSDASAFASQDLTDCDFGPTCISDGTKEIIIEFISLAIFLEWVCPGDLNQLISQIKTFQMEDAA
jgi:hypothetical protein